MVHGRDDDTLLLCQSRCNSFFCTFLTTALCFCPGVEYSSRNVLTDPDIREGVKKFSEWPTIPQVYINGEFVGGSDILMGMHESGELKKVFLDEKA